MTVTQEQQAPQGGRTAGPGRAARTGVGALAGALSAAFALGAGELAAVLTGPQSSPVVSVGSQAVDLAPTPLKEYAVRTFGTHDKAVLLGGIYAVLVLLALAAGVAALRRPRLGVPLFAVFGAVGVWAAVSRPTGTAAWSVPSLVAAACGAAVLHLLVRTGRAAVGMGVGAGHARAAGPGSGAKGGPGAADIPEAGDAAAPEERASGPSGPGERGPEAPVAAPPAPAALDRRRFTAAAGATALDRRRFTAAAGATALDRRRFTAAAGATALAAAGAGFGGRALDSRRYDRSAAREAVRIPAPVRRAPAVPAGAHPRVPGLSPLFTPNAGFYRVDTALVVPQVDPRDWRLRIHGMVDHAVEITFDDLLRRPLEEHDLTLSCVSNEVGGPYAGTARWIGAPLAALLREAGVRRGADQLVSRSVDGMSIGTPVDAVLDGRAGMLAVAMNGEVLPAAHGFPCRMLVPGLFGYVSATKWLTELEVTTFDAYDPYWVRREWAPRAPVKTASRIEVPKPFARVASGAVTVAGTAWATHRGVDAVEVRVDGGPWAEARLAPQVSEDVWRQWTWDWTAPPGTHRIEVRATDGTGAVQTEARATPFPDGATGWHSTVVTVT
ncbi:molybdopterin-dependent oxidoreductase [Streptacidiphilus sp. ASG 303]|uniref:molybdopterin-dependent oxidoreductase n=1 Tax=Streptacidiphilus sp. ASG 303 TaxID=2896847 RepID=UPI001E5509FA|nr:molybdopterin-dependent oxidoreductase [Streptacidiphilus sp. ASG 303]MCD0483349.1 molybdopterin-dependent oxidoreductase [Streptacidiphilus sp. ASG 303]